MSYSKVVFIWIRENMGSDGILQGPWKILSAGSVWLIYHPTDYHEVHLGEWSGLCYNITQWLLVSPLPGCSLKFKKAKSRFSSQRCRSSLFISQFHQLVPAPELFLIFLFTIFPVFLFSATSSGSAVIFLFNLLIWKLWNRYSLIIRYSF